jgi:hypothetical protein
MENDEDDDDDNDDNDSDDDDDDEDDDNEDNDNDDDDDNNNKEKKDGGALQTKDKNEPNDPRMIVGGDDHFQCGYCGIRNMYPHYKAFERSLSTLQTSLHSS